jgi:hypothetical protein
MNTTQAHLQVEIDSSLLSTVQTTLDNRPLNTKRKYETYQQQFIQWCTLKGFQDNSTVTAGKLHLFLSDEVVGRASKKNKSNVIGHSSVCGYANAIVDLYSQQSHMHMNSNPHPRNNAVKQLLKNVEQSTTATRRRNYTDRGTGSLLDGYQSTEQFVNISLRFLEMNDIRGRACFLLSHYGLLRGENIRDLELADMFSQVLDGEGFSFCTALVLLIQHGKTNQYGKLQHVGYMRNKDVRLCPIGSAAMYFFQRFHIEKECFPDFRNSKSWYDIKFLRGRNKSGAISYDSHKKSFVAVFDSLGLSFNKKTHINRQQGVRELENADVDISQTRRHGRWGTDTCEGTYSAPLAREAMRGLSGHPPKQRLYYIPRSHLVPPLSLQKQLFPDADLALQCVIEGNGHERNLAARGFLELIIHMRIVLLQDCAVLNANCPFLPLWVHPIFNCPEFKEFQHDLSTKMDSTPDPTELRLTQSLPLLSAQLKNQHGSLSNDIREVKESVEQGHKILQRFVSGGMLLRVLPVEGNTDRANELDRSEMGKDNTAEDEPINVTTSYEMSRAVTTVAELWKEWHEGLASNPSVEEMEEKFGRKWRATSKESKFFSRRKTIIDYVKQVVSTQRVSWVEAVRKVDEERGSKSLDALSKIISSAKA